MRIFFITSALMLLTFHLVAQEDSTLRIRAGDTKLLRNSDGSFELFVRKTPAVESILMTDSTADPDEYSDSYSLRAYESHPTFANERRTMNNRFIDNEERLSQGLEPLYFLMSSAAGSIDGFEEGTLWFHIHLPSSVIFGYPWAREGQLDIDAGTWLSIRAFGAKNADYSGGFRDNPFVISRKLPDISVTPREKPFQVLALATSAKFYNVKSSNDIFTSMTEIMSGSKLNSLDLAIVLDTTISMKEHLAVIKKELVKAIERDFTANYPEKKLRIALVFYRDYPPDQYITQLYPFTNNLDSVQGYLDRAIANGGRDIPEAVYEGIDVAADQLDWQSPNKIIIQIGDAIPHPKPKGLVTEASVLEKVQRKNIKVYPILLPDPLAKQRK